MKRKIIYMLSVPLALLMFALPAWGRDRPTAKPADAATLSAFNVNVISQDCMADGSASATVNWVPSTLGIQFVDVTSVDPNFIPGTFFGMGLAPFQSRVLIENLIPGMTQFLRLNALTPFGWRPLPVVSFTTPFC